MKKKVLVVVLWKKTPESADKRVLLLQRPAKEGGYWQSVTGGVEEGEEYWQAAEREAREETSLRFERHPQPLGLAQDFDGRWGRAHEEAFSLTVLNGECPPKPVLDPKEHSAYEWCSPGEAAKKVKFPFNKAAIERASMASPPLHLSRSGIFRQEGEEITHARTVELLHRSLARQGTRYVVQIGKESLEVVVESSPRFVRMVDRDSGKIKLLGGFEEILDAGTLRFGSSGALHCTLANGWDAQFLSSAYYELAKNIEEKKGKDGSTKYVLHFLGRDHELPVPHKSETVDR